MMRSEALIKAIADSMTRPTLALIKKTLEISHIGFGDDEQKEVAADALVSVEIWISGGREFLI